MKFDTNDFRDQLEGRKILITGASGFIGQNLSKKLIDIGATVHGTSRNRYGSDPDIPGMFWWQGTFDDHGFARKILKKSRPDYIFHLAGDVTAANDQKHLLSTYNSLLTSTVNLLTEAVDMGCEKIVLTGSSTEPMDINETPGSPYAAAKLGTVIYGKLFQQLYKLPVVMIRPFMGYGPAQPKYKILPHVIMSILNGHQPKLTSGQWEVDWIYIDDLVEGILTATTHKEDLTQTLDLGTGKLTSVRAMVEKIVDIMETDIEPDFGAIPDRPIEQSRIADVETTRSLIGWEAKTSLDTGLRNMVNWFKKQVRELKHAFLFLGIIGNYLTQVLPYSIAL